MEHTECINQLENMLLGLNKISNGAYNAILQKQENSIDFIMDGDMKLIGISYQVDPRTFIRLSPVSMRGEGDDGNVGFNIDVIAKIQDFTTGKNEEEQSYSFFEMAKHPIAGPEELHWDFRVERLHVQVIKTSAHLLKTYTPSHRLSQIVGPEPKTKLEILDLVSRYILSNNLRLSNGHLRVSGNLKAFYRKNTVTVCENTFFDTLRENTLLTESQLQKSGALVNLFSTCNINNPSQYLIEI